MTEVLLFHHALGRTPAIIDFADHLRHAGHVVHVPDLFEGQTYSRIEDGVAFAQHVGFSEIVRRGQHVAQPLTPSLVYMGFSLGVLPAQTLAQTREGARGAVLAHACLPAEDLGGWPLGVRAQIHAMDADPIFLGDGDLHAARQLVEQTDEAELFLYPGKAHLFAETGSESYNRQTTDMLLARVLTFLDAVGTESR